MNDRKSHWQRVYHDKSALDVSWYQRQPELSMELIEKSIQSKHDPIIDVGGGASVLVDFLLVQGYQNVSVLDISQAALDSAKSRLGSRAVGVKWYEADITTFKPPDRYTVWHDRAVLHFLTETSDRAKYVRVLKQAVMPGGYLIIAAFAIGGPESCSGLEIVQYDTAKLMEVLGEGFELLDEIDEIHITPANKAQQFRYYRLRRHA